MFAEVDHVCYCQADLFTSVVYLADNGGFIVDVRETTTLI